MNDKQKQLYSYLKDNDLTDLDSTTFFSKYSDPSKSKEIYAYLKQNGMTDLDENAFHVTYFSPANKKKSTTVSQSVQPKKPTSSATMPSWMQSSLESSVKKEEKTKKPAGPQVTKSSELNKDVQAEKIASMAGGGTAGISGVGAINAKPKKEEAPDFDVYYGYPGQEKNEYRISNGRWERKYGEKWVEVTNQGSISSLTKFFNKEKEITVDAVFTGFPGKEENKYRISELQNGQKVWEVQRAGQKDYTVISDQGSIDALNRQFDKKIEYAEDAQSKRDAQINRRESAAEDFKTVTGNLVGKESDEVAKYLRKMYGDRGFSFQPTGLFTDNIRVTADGTGRSEVFVLDNFRDETDSAEALKLRKFLSENQQLGDYIDLEREELKKAEETIVDTEWGQKDFNKEMDRLKGAGSQAEFKLAEKQNIEDRIAKDINKYSTETVEARKLLVRADYDTKQRIDDLTRTAKTKDEKQAVAAIAVANKGEFVQKHRVDNAYLNDLNQASKSISSSFNKLNSDVEEFNTYIKNNNITKEQLDNDPDLLAQKQELQVRYDQLIADAEDLDFENKKLPFIQNQNARNAALYFAYDETRGSVIGGTWNGFLRGALGSLQTFRITDKEGIDSMVKQFGSYTTKAFTQSENRNDFSRALLSTSESLGAAAAAFMTGGLAAEGTVASKILQFVPYFSVSYNEMKNEIDAIPGMNKVPWYKKEALAIAYGVGVGYLDKLSTNFQLKSKISNKIGRDLVLRSIAGLPKGATAESIEMAIASNFKKDIAAGVIKIIAGSVVEGTTEGVQSAYGTGLKELYDWMNGVDEFDSREWTSQVFEEAYYGALGGTIMSTPSTLIQGIKNGFGRLDPQDMELARKVIEDSNMRSMVITDIKAKLMSGEITKDQANEQIEAIKESESLFAKIPDNLSAEDTSKAMDLIKERSKIEADIKGKDKDLVSARTRRITAINNELKTISENATKESEQQQQEVTAEGGSVQREGVIEGQPEVGQGEGTVGQTKEQGTDLGNRPVEGQKKVTGRIAINRPGILSSFGGQQFDTPLEGDTYVEGQRVMFEEKGTGRVYDLGNVNEMMDNEIEGLTQVEESVVVQPDGKLSVDGNNWNIQTDLPTMGIEYNPAGEVTRVSLKDDNGNTTMFDGQKAVDIAYQIELQKIQSPEQQQLINDLLEQDEEFQAATADIELTEAPNVVQEETATDTKPTAKPTVTAAAAPKITETTDTKAYSEALSEAKAELKAEGNGLDLQVSDVSQEEADAIIAEGGKIFMTEDGLAGAYVKKDGYMGGLFKNPKATYKEVAKLLQQARIKVGGRFMDAYATELEKIYVKNGFRPVARLKFNEEYAPEGWDAPGSALAGKPDVVFFAYDPEGKYSIGDGEYVTDYDAAYEMAKNFDAKTANEADRLAAILDKKAVVSKDVISREEINKRVSLAQKALKIILPDVKFVVHDTNEAFIKATGDLSAGAYDPRTKTIHINAKGANRRTVSHEVFHAIIISKVASDKQLQKLTANMVDSVLKSLKQTGTNQAVIKYLEDFAAQYKNDPTVMNEERLAELHGILGENMIELPLPTQNIIKRFLDRLAKMFGLKEMTDREAVEFMNTMSSKVETGKEITDKEFKAGKDTVKSAIKRFQANFKDEVSGLEFVYDENGEKFSELEKNGFITKDRSITNFDGQYMFFHQPDAAFSGMIVKRNKKNGEVELLIEGKGGMYYPIKFHENGFFWASTSKVAEKMANDLNEAMEQNGGKLLMALTSAPYDKLLSSTTAANSVMELISSKAFDRNFAISPAQLKNILINAAAFTKEQKNIIKDKNKKPILDKNGNVQYRIKNVGLGIKIKKGDSLDDVKSKIKELLDPDAKSFADRKTFVEAMIKETVDIINSNPKAISQFGEFFSTGIQNKYFKGTRKKGYNISAANMKQALSEMLTEPMLKEGVNRDKGGQIYAIIELDGRVKPVDSDLHESYPKAIQSVDPKNNKVKLHILTDRVKWNEVVEDFETNDIVAPGDRELEIFPTSGISVRALKVNTKNIVKEEKTSEVENKSNIRQQKPLQPEVAEKLTEDGKGNFVFNHYSDKKRDVIKPGTGQNMITSREEASALSAVGGLAQYYTMDMQKEPGTGPNQHTILILKERVYYFNKDQEGFYDEAKRRFEEVRPGQAFSPNYQVAFITQVAIDNGYDIVVANWRNGELRAQTTMELTPSDKIIEFKPLKAVTYEVGDTIEVYGTKAKITAIDGDIITFKGETASGSINFKRSPKSIQKVATPKEQVEEEVKSLDDEIDTDKSKFRRQKASDQAAVIVKTGKEAGLSDAGIREYMKRNGYTDRQAIEAIQAYNDKKEGIFIDPEWSSLRKAAVLFKRKFLNSRGLLANTVFASNEARLAIIAKQLNISQKLIVDFDRELEVIRKNSVAQYKKDVRAYINGDPTVNLPAEIKALIDKKTGIKDRIKLASAINKLAKDNVEKQRADFDAYIRDKAAVLPLELKKIADSMRAHIDSISRELISNGLIDENLAERVIDNLGSYLNRSYKIYDRKNWKNEIETEVRQKAINFLKIQMRPIAEEQARKDNRDVDETLNDLVDRKIEKYLSQQEDDMKLFSSGGKLGSKNLSTLKAREEIPVEIRMLMGEYTDPGQNYARTILKMSALAANHQFLNEVKKAGTGVFLFEKNDSKTPKGYSYEIAAEGSETMNPLNGMYTSKELKEEFEKEVSQLGTFMTFYMNILSRVKWGKTIMSPATHLKNVIGNIGFVLVNGHWRINEMAGAYKAVRDDIRSLDKKESRAYINKLIELGIVKQGAGMGEIRAMFADASWEETMLNNINKNTGSRWGKVKSGWNKFARGAENVYQAEDDFYKVFAYENELSRYSKAMFGKSKKELTPDERAEVDKVVAEIVKNTYPTYSRIPEAVNMIRRFPFVGNFISFQAESYRTAYMTAQLALQEIKSDNPKIRRIGAQRMTGALMYKTIKLGILSYYSYAAGMGLVGLLGYFTDDEEEKQKENDVRKFLPEWATNSDIVVQQASNGKIKYIDMSASDPHGGINKVINSFLLGKTTLDSFINGIGSIVEPFVGEEMTTAALLALKNNENAYGKPIYNPEDTFYEKSKKITGFMFNVVQPGAVASGRRVYNAKDITEEVVGATTGIRTYEIDVAESFKYQMMKYQERIINANSIYTSEVYNEEATDKSIANSKKRAEKAVTEIHAEIYELYYSAVRLGADEDMLYDHLKSFGRMSDDSIDYMFAQEEFYIEDKYPEEE